jgi:hypothetical protein
MRVALVRLFSSIVVANRSEWRQQLNVNAFTFTLNCQLGKTHALLNRPRAVPAMV